MDVRASKQRLTQNPMRHFLEYTLIMAVSYAKLIFNELYYNFHLVGIGIVINVLNELLSF